MIKLIECPRDAIQGISTFIPTKEKAAYINQLLKVGFDTIDFGSFVSPKAIPQLSDTAEVLDLLEMEQTTSKLLAIVANSRGGKSAASYAKISYLGFPFSISETFQLRNTNSTIRDSLHIVRELCDICEANEKQLVIYISMGFGNPYGDDWSPQIVCYWLEQLHQLGVKIFAISDTIGVADPENIHALFSQIIPQYSYLEIGAHFHTPPQHWESKFEAALSAGCARFDGAIKGFGGCPMAKDELTGNMATEHMIHKLNQLGIPNHILLDELEKSIEMATKMIPLL
ncbi:MAG TPA: hydroxymethylglutaryl-CoA lyase [Saprospirales bacterium]|nr:hydroxymethylglutaryl-CoA lyase [Saprospirales bacterium]